MIVSILKYSNKQYFIDTSEICIENFVQKHNSIVYWNKNL